MRALVLQPDGKILIGGPFTKYDDTPCGHIARLNPDGSLDDSFNPGEGANGEVHALALQPDGKILIGGGFSYYDGTYISRIARLNPDGSLDTNFNPGNGANGTVQAIALQPNGKILIGGWFTTYGGETRNCIARLKPDGSLDTTFDPGTGADSFVYALALQPDGKILIGGNFTEYDDTPRNRIARLNDDGSLDTTFDSSNGANRSVQALARQPDGKILIGGYFTEYDDTPRDYIARLNSNGSLDTEFGSGGEAPDNQAFLFVSAIARQPDGKILIGGSFITYNGTARKIARLKPNGSLDTTFNPGSGPNYLVDEIALQPDGKSIIGGGFTSYDGYSRNYIARLIGSAKTVSPTTNVPYHGVVTYTITARNHLTQTDPLVVLTDTLPVEVDFVQWVEQPSGATVSDDELHWRGEIAANENVTFTFQARHVGDYGDVVMNTAVWKGTVISEHSASATFTVEPPPPLYVRKQTDTPYVVHGESLTYTLKIGNGTAMTLTNVAITDTLPAVLTATTFISDSAALALQPDSHYAWLLAELPPGERVHITVTSIISPDARLGAFDNTAYIAGLLLTETLTYSDTATADIVPPTYTLSITTTGSGFGVVTPTVGSYVYPHHQPITLEAAPSPTSTFEGWSGAGLNGTTTKTVTLTMDANKAVTATFDLITHTLTIAKTGTGDGVVTPTVSAHTYTSGAVVPLDATAYPTSTFDGWSGDSDCLDASVTMTASKTCTATFTTMPVLTMAITGTGDGIVTPTVGAHSYVSGTVVGLEASPSPTSTFGGWSGDSDCLDASVTMTASKTCTATFTTMPVLTMAITGTGDGIVTPTVGTHSYVSGTVVGLEASPYPTSTFDGWSGDSDCLDASVIMTANKACTATFTLSAAPPKLAIGKTAEEYRSAPPLLVGDQILYTIRVTNTSTGTLTNLVVTDTLPAGVTYFRTPKGSPRPNQTGNPVVWERASLDANATQTFRVIVKATGDVSLLASNVATATCSEDTTPQTATANLDNATVQKALTLRKDAVDVNGAPLLINDIIRYPITVTNTHDTVTMTHVVVTDTLPAGTVMVSATQNYTEAAGTLWWQAGDLTPGASWTTYVDQRVDGTVNPIAGNVAAVRSDQQDWQETGEITPPDPVVPTFTLTTAITGTGNGSISPTVGSHSYLAGTVVTFTATPDSGSTFDGWRGDADCSDGVVTMDAHKACTATFTLAAAPAKLAIGKTAEEYRSAPPLLVGDQILYTIRVTNTSDSALTNLIVTDTLPAGVTYFRTPKGAPRPEQTGNPIVWKPRDPLDANATQTFRVIVKVDGTTNPIGANHVTAICTEQDVPAGAIAPAPDDGIHEPGLIITGTLNSGSGTFPRWQTRAPASALAVGDLLTYTLTVTNSNDSLTLHNLVVTATLPSGAELVNATPTGSLILPHVRWQQAELGPGVSWHAQVVVRQTAAMLGEMALTAATDEQSPLEITITPPGGGQQYVYLPLVVRH